MAGFGAVLGIWAHPDDESYLSAGLFMRARAMGDRVACITATRGELGSTDERRWPAGPELAEVRTRESDAAFRIYGVTEHHWLDHPDGGCAGVDTAVALEAILPIAREFRPDTIVSFGPKGLTGHPDHRTVAGWALATRTALGTPRLLQAVTARSVADRFEPRMRELGVYIDDAEAEIAADEDCVTLGLGPVEVDRKWQALVVQPSQTEAFFATAGHDLIREFIATESFVAADPTKVV